LEVVVKALTLYQPWATFIADGHKRFETRSWKTAYRGELAIHAGRKADYAALAHLRQRNPALAHYRPERLPSGVIVAICELVRVWQTEEIRYELNSLELDLGDYNDGRFAWELRIIRIPPKPIPARGGRMLWEWEP
jgi:hypothetical protein